MDRLQQLDLLCNSLTAERYVECFYHRYVYHNAMQSHKSTKFIAWFLPPNESMHFCLSL